MLIADMGSVRPGLPTLTVALRGTAIATVELTTLAGPKHSGQFGGAAPDALIVLMHALASLHDEHGDVTVEGLRREEWTGASYSDDEFHELAEVQAGPAADRQRRPRLARLVWSRDHDHRDRRPVGRDALNAVYRTLARRSTSASIPHRTPPRPRPRSSATWRRCGRSGSGSRSTRPRRQRVRGRDAGPAYRAAREALQAAWGVEASFAATGGSIPLVNALHQAVREAEILLLGATDGYANIHAPNERVVLEEFEKAVLVEAEFLGRSPRSCRSEAVTAAPRDPGEARADGPHARRDRARRQQDAEPGDPVRLAVRARDRPLRAARVGRRQGHLPGRKPPPVTVTEVVQGGSTQPSGGLPDASVQEGDYIVEETAEVKSLLSAEGVRFLFTSFVANFRNFAAVAIILVVMIGVGLAEAVGLIGALIRKLVGVSSEAMLTPIIIFIGVLSSVASDAGYLVLIPLGAAAFKSVGRNPLAGIAAAFAGVAAGFGVNFLITPLDGVLTEITNDASSLVDPDRRSTWRPTSTSASPRRSSSRSC